MTVQQLYYGFRYYCNGCNKEHSSRSSTLPDPCSVCRKSDFTFLGLQCFHDMPNDVEPDERLLILFRRLIISLSAVQKQADKCRSEFLAYRDSVKRSND